MGTISATAFRLPPSVISALFGLFAMWGIAATADGSNAPAAQSIEVLSGTYGSNCGLPRGNASRDLTRRCNGNETCSYELGDRLGSEPMKQCRPDFLAEWRCGNAELHTAALAPEAKSGDTLVLSCARVTGAGK
ncbi:hypothetical protein [Trinickia sp. EG282A]|uniref:hypothetical protein n=1 Tax=Trinickia sp. EG282A TaxID=3237013 RepID=UPI0034D1A6A4